MRPLLLLVLLFPSLAHASLRVRAREHLEWSSIRFDGAPTADHFTLASNINAWWEEPFVRAFGLSFAFGGPSEMKLFRLGLEYKHFLYKGLFGRGGLSAAWLDTRSPRGKFFGAGPYLGLGWEFPVGRLGLAPELAVQHFSFDGARYWAFTPSIGVHFYMFKGDPKP